VKQETIKTQAQFPKDAVLKSQKYGEYCDLLSAVLEDGKAYTSAEVDDMIEKFQKGMVK
jgi:hypothetical protein